MLAIDLVDVIFFHCINYLFHQYIYIMDNVIFTWFVMLIFPAVLNAAALYIKQMDGIAEYYYSWSKYW